MPRTRQSQSGPEPSPEQPRVVDCPQCEAPVAVKPVTVVRPRSGDLKRLFKGDLNRVTCEACQTAFVLDVPILYRDDEARFLVYFIAEADPAQWPECERRMQAVTAEVFTAAGGQAPPSCRLVTDRSALIEKIALHERGLDDRIIEYIKYQLYQTPGGSARLDPVRQRLLYDFSSEPADGRLAFVVFDREHGRATAGAHLPIEVYREVAEAFTSNLGMRDELESLFPGYMVSVDRIL